LAGASGVEGGVMKVADAKHLVRQRLIVENELPEIPSGWTVERLRFVFSESKERNGKEPVGEMLSVSEYHGVTPKEYDAEERKRADDEIEAYRVVRPGQLAVNSMWLNHLGLGVSDHLGYVSPAYEVYDISDRLDARFVHHLMRSQFYLRIYTRYLYGIRPNSFQIKSYDWANIPVIVPDLATQKQIADFLDTETARIDALIEKKQRVLASVADARFATISRALSVGLDDNAPLIETASPYLPKIPATWRIWRLKHLARVRGGMTLGRTLPEGVSVTTTPYLRVANVQAGWLDLSDVAEIDVTETEIKRFSLRRGDVLMNEGGDNDKLGRGAVWHAPFEPCLNQNHVFCVRPSDLRYSDWISMATNARYARDFFYLHSNQSTNLASISKTNVEKLPIAVPPPEEMRAVLDQLNARLDRFTAITEKVTTSINRLREYRAALITAAVTGQIDVAAHVQPVKIVPRRAGADIVPLHANPRPTSLPDRRAVRVLVAAEVVHRLGVDPYLGRIKLQKLMFLAEAHANINEIDGCYERYRAGPYDGAMMTEIETGLRQEQFYAATEDATSDRRRITFQRMQRAGDHRDALSVTLGDRVVSLRSMVDLFKDMNTEATEAVATLYAVWNDALIDGQQLDDAAIIRGFLQEWHKDKDKFRQSDLQHWLGWMHRKGIVPRGAGPRTISTSTPSLFEGE
jgi:type I restriction enzyme, S subunit